MKLIELYIKSHFRNLNKLKIEFPTESRACVIIGNNGAGKSNILEAISAIFNSLYSYGSQEYKGPGFGYIIKYEKQDQTVKISYDLQGGLKMSVDEKPLETFDKSYLPKRIVCNYSGEDRRIYDSFYADPYKNYLQTIIHSAGNEPLKMVFVDKTFWDRILLLMLANRNPTNKFDEYLKNELHCENNNDVKVKLQLDENKLEAWNPNRIKSYFTNIIGHINNDNTIDIDVINPSSYDVNTLFNIWLGANDIVKEIDIEIGVVSAKHLSEGEKKMMTVTFIIEAIADEETLVLLDEPDSHLHVSKKKNLVEYLSSVPNRDTVLTSHSPTVTAACKSSDIIMLGKENDKVKVINKTQYEIINEITENTWSYEKQNIFFNSTKDILLLEGALDEMYISKALKIFKDDGKFKDLDFDYVPCGGAANIVRFIEKISISAGRFAFIFVDRDGAGLDTLKSVFKNKEINFKNFGNARKYKDFIWAAPYPVPKGKKKDNFNIEDYFSRKVLCKYLLECRVIDDLSKNTFKVKMEEACKKDKIKHEYYKNFEMLFNLIERIKEAQKEGKDKI